MGPACCELSVLSMLITVTKAQDTQASRGDGVKPQCCGTEFGKTLKLLPCEHQAAWISRAWDGGHFCGGK